MLLKNIANKAPNIRSQILLISLGLLISILLCYWPVKDFEFINFDDDKYVTDNRIVQSGINKDSIIWAFSVEDKNRTYWHPLSWLSHMLDVQLYGMNPGQHHLTNVLFHILNTLLLFLVLQRMTGAIWQSAFVAALFAVHPINVESVAWVAERKNVLSTFFFILTLLAYAFYTEKPAIVRYIVMLLCFTLGLAAKPMLVTLPFLLLLLDFWPLGRLELLQTGSDRRLNLYHLVCEKIPLFLLSGLSIYLASASIQGIGMFKALQSEPVTLRIANAFVSYAKYIGKMIWPQDLAVFYPFPKMVELYQSLGAFLTIVCVSILAIVTYKKQPYLMIGWFWFLGTLVPVIGLVQAGLWPALADRWTYVPMIGLFTAVTWGLSDLLRRCCTPKFGFIIGMLIVVCMLIVITRDQVGYWKNSVTLFDHTLAVTKNNFVAHNNIGQRLLELGKNNEALRHFAKAIEINPTFEIAHLNLGLAFSNQGRIGQAIQHYSQALQINPRYTVAHNNLGNAWYRLGEAEKAYAQYLKAIKINPEYAEAYNGLGAASIRLGDLESAVGFFRKALIINPQFTGARNNLTNTLAAIETKDGIIPSQP